MSLARKIPYPHNSILTWALLQSEMKNESPLESFSLVMICYIHLGLDEEEGKKERRKERKKKMLKNLLADTYTWRHPNLSEQKIQANHTSILQWCWVTVQIVGWVVKRYHALNATSTCRNLLGHNYKRYQGSEYKPLWEAVVGLVVAWCSNPVSGITSAWSALLSKQARNNENIPSLPRSL